MPRLILGYGLVSPHSVCPVILGFGGPGDWVASVSHPRLPEGPAERGSGLGDGHVDLGLVSEALVDTCRDFRATFV